VITAAHCVDNVRLQATNMKLVGVRLGEWDTSKEKDCQCAFKSCDCECAESVVDIDVAEVIIHENYNPLTASRENDIALIRLSRRIENFTEYISPICLPYDGHAKLHIPDPNENVTVAVGWGYKEGGIINNIKSRRAVNLSNCTTLHENETKTVEVNLQKQFCAGGLHSLDTCVGEIGSPLMKLDTVTHNWRLVGIFSVGTHDCNGTGSPGVYTRVSQYTDWIVDKLINGFTKSTLK